MKHLVLVIAAIAALAACAPKTAPETAAASAPSVLPAEPPHADPAPPTDLTPPAGEDTCSKTQHAALIGKPVTTAGVPPASPAVRHIDPKTQVTMDFRPDRLNIDIDDKGVITGFRCG